VTFSLGEDSDNNNEMLTCQTFSCTKVLVVIICFTVSVCVCSAEPRKTEKTVLLSVLAEGSAEIELERLSLQNIFFPSIPSPFLCALNFRTTTTTTTSNHIRILYTYTFTYTRRILSHTPNSVARSLSFIYNLILKNSLPQIPSSLICLLIQITTNLNLYNANYKEVHTR